MEVVLQAGYKGMGRGEGTAASPFWVPGTGRSPSIPEVRPIGQHRGRVLLTKQDPRLQGGGLRLHKDLCCFPALAHQVSSRGRPFLLSCH